MKIVDRLDRLNGWIRIWLILTIGLSLAAFVVFLGEPAIYDTTNLIGIDAEKWIASNRAEWGSRCIPGTFQARINAWESIGSSRFSCYSIFVDGIPALVGALGVALTSCATLKIFQWVLNGFVRRQS
jgi:hypothetical protein